MCRMLLHIGETTLKPLITALERMARDQNSRHEENEGELGTFPHDDGWGVSFLQAGEFVTARSTKPCWKDPALKELASIKTRVALLHARRATVGEIALENTHPFQAQHKALGDVLFCHNGTVEDELPTTRKGQTDTERLFHHLLSRLREDPATNIRDAINELHAYSATNSILLTSEKAYISTHRTEKPTYYTLHKARTNDGLAISSERIEDLAQEWEPLPENAVVTVPLELRKAIPT